MIESIPIPISEGSTVRLKPPRESAALTIALSKGRMQGEALDLLARSGIILSKELQTSRKLTHDDESGRYRFIFVKPADVPVYVEHGVADCGVVGLDVLLESDADLVQPLDLGIACCKIAVAVLSSTSLDELPVVRVATKYPRIAGAHFGRRGIPVEIINLSGSVELGPVLGLSDCIVDLVETGRTLVENGLEVYEEIAQSTGRLIVNRASYQMKSADVLSLVRNLKSVLVQN
jgi:ATP phosphoribosyltransferase